MDTKIESAVKAFTDLARDNGLKCDIETSLVHAETYISLMIKKSGKRMSASINIDNYGGRVRHSCFYATGGYYKTLSIKSAKKFISELKFQ